MPYFQPSRYKYPILIRWLEINDFELILLKDTYLLGYRTREIRKNGATRLDHQRRDLGQIRLLHFIIFGAIMAIQLNMQARKG